VESLLLTRDQALSLWSGNTDSKTVAYQTDNPKEYQIVRTHTKEATWIQDKQKLSSNLTLYEAYTNHWTSKLRRAETKRKKEFNPEAWE